MWKPKFRSILAEQLTRARKTDSSYSMRDLARHLKLNSGPLSELLSGKRAITRRTAETLFPALIMTDAERKDCRRLMSVAPLDDSSLETTQLIELIGNPIYGAIIACLQLDNGPKNVAGVATRLSLMQEEVALAWQRLTALNILVEASSGEIIPAAILPVLKTDKTPEIRKPIADWAVKIGRETMLKAAREQTVARSRIFSGSQRQVENLVKEIEKFSQSLSHFAEGEQTDAIYLLNVHLMPM